MIREISNTFPSRFLSKLTHFSWLYLQWHFSNKEYDFFKDQQFFRLLQSLFRGSTVVPALNYYNSITDASNQTFYLLFNHTLKV